MAEKHPPVAIADAIGGFFLWVVGECAGDFMVWQGAGALGSAATAAFGLGWDGHEGFGGGV